ncbi:uncharacterized protein B0T15DRAFT_391360 [Chaetomium strumarium]|uniref:Phosphatidate phosphatase APP1 catalytic domain-containing protein n=1 Tax=Chaetomium strumarium TaxID=1170767 RepID=A0AAJ0M4X4_9PEZI|nr:hypothetical protein B0T15DRAFT_391360 [Chaetomium strumarium]
MSHRRSVPSSRRTTAEFERQTRSRSHFSDTESSLVGVSTSQSRTSRKVQKITEVLSWLGSRNPLPAKISGDDVVWLMDNVAFRDSKGTWQAEFVAATFDQQPSESIVDVVGDIADKVGLARGELQEEAVERRIGPFVMCILPGRQIKVKFNGSTPLKLGPTGRNGISSDLKALPGAAGGSVVTSAAEVPKGVVGMLEMKTVFAEPDGWAVISDIDDTIKVTQTSNPIGILRSTFVSEPTPVAGMPELCSQIRDLVGPSAPWFYLSASPYNLYPFLRSFRDAYYPHGQLILSVSGLLQSLTMETERYKVDRMEKIHRWLPRRKMICIGDSTQSDPEAYGDIARAFPGWIKLILIRQVNDIAAIGIKEKNEPERFEKAFDGLPR